MSLKKSKSCAILLLGTNQGKRTEALMQAQELLVTEAVEIVSCSRIYESEAWGKTDQANFLNQALEISTPLTARQLLNHALACEQKMGRVRQERWGPRLIDIDILVMDELIIEEPGLELPHPRLHNRRFALLPLCDLQPSDKHPVLKLSYSQLLAECPDELAVWLFKD